MVYLIAGLIVAALLALAMIAFQHPAFFKKIYWPLVILAMLSFLASVVWNISSSATLSAVLPYIRDDSISAALSAAESVALSGLWSSLVYLGFVIYLGLLALVPAKITERRALQTQAEA